MNCCWKRIILDMQNLPNLKTNEDPSALHHFAVQLGMLFDRALMLGCNVDNESTITTIADKLPLRVINALITLGRPPYSTTTRVMIQDIKHFSNSEKFAADLHNNRQQRHHATTMSAVHHQNKKGRHGQGNQNKSENQQSEIVS